MHDLYAKSSMLHWYPKVRHLDIPQPKTEIVRIPFSKFAELLDGDSTLSEYRDRFSEIMDSLGQFPIFLRTDHSSQKHLFKQTCRLPNKSALLGHILELVDNNMASDLQDNALVFREWIDFDAGFVAFEGHLPISIEARVFVNHNKIQCVHPYWPEDAIGTWLYHKMALDAELDQKSRIITNPRWREILKSQNDFVMQSRPILEKYAVMVAESIGDGDCWSVDFAFGRDGKWYLIDCAAGQVSYHYPDCKYSETS